MGVHALRLGMAVPNPAAERKAVAVSRDRDAPTRTARYTGEGNAMETPEIVDPIDKLWGTDREVSNTSRRFLRTLVGLPDCDEKLAAIAHLRKAQAFATMAATAQLDLGAVASESPVSVRDELDPTVGSRHG